MAANCKCVKKYEKQSDIEKNTHVLNEKVYVFTIILLLDISFEC